MSFHLLYYIIINFKKKQVLSKIYELSYMYDKNFEECYINIFDKNISGV